MENLFALLNYDMENDKSTPEFEKATKTIKDILDKAGSEIKKTDWDGDVNELGSIFYDNFHFGCIRKNVALVGHEKVDAILKTAVDALNKYSDGPEDDGGLGDTATDECVSYYLESILEE